MRGYAEQAGFVDFGMAPQLYQALIDPTAGEIMRERCPAVVKWAEKMSGEPSAEGGFEAYESLKDTLEPILLKQVSLFLKWSEANAGAIARKEEEMSVEINGKTWWQVGSVRMSSMPWLNVVFYYRPLVDLRSIRPRA